MRALDTVIMYACIPPKHPRNAQAEPPLKCLCHADRRPPARPLMNVAPVGD